MWADFEGGVDRSELERRPAGRKVSLCDYVSRVEQSRAVRSKFVCFLRLALFCSFVGLFVCFADCACRARKEMKPTGGLTDLLTDRLKNYR